MTNRAARLGVLAFVVTTASLCSRPSFAADSSAAPGEIPKSSRLIVLAAAKFPNLTRAERAMLWYADVDNIARGEIAVGATSANFDDPGNDPAHADKWDAQREIRASLIEWLCVNPDAVRLVDPHGIRIIGGRIVGAIDLSHVRVPFALVMRRCAFAERITMVGSELPHLDLDGSYVREINAWRIIVHGSLNMGKGFHASGEVSVAQGTIDGDLDCHAGHFQVSVEEMEGWANQKWARKMHLNLALAGEAIRVRGAIYLCCGFEAKGPVWLFGASVGDSIYCHGASFSAHGSHWGPESIALAVPFAEVGNMIDLGDDDAATQWFKAEGFVNISGTRLRLLIVENARFIGTPNEPHGLDAGGANIAGALVIKNVSFEAGAVFWLSGTKVQFLLDEKKSWPGPGNLMIDGFTYDGFGADSPWDVKTRLGWIDLQSPQLRLSPQPFRQLATTYSKTGNDDLATQVLIAKDDAHYGSYGFMGRMWGGFLKWTIGYGHRPLLAFIWMLAVVLIGSAVVLVGKRAGVMRLTWPETTPPPPTETVNGLHPLLYSLDVFLPFVNLHQEHYFWPDEAASGRCNVAGREFRVDGWMLRYYLWLQIIAGWLLSVIFLAGVTGLIRND